MAHLCTRTEGCTPLSVLVCLTHVLDELKQAARPMKEEEEEELCVVCDGASSRIAGSFNRALDRRACSWQLHGLTEQLPQLLTDCKLLDGPLTGNKCTFWIGAQDEPECLLEAIAISVFRQHTGALAAYTQQYCPETGELVGSEPKEATFDPTRSGAECKPAL